MEEMLEGIINEWFDDLEHNARVPIGDIGREYREALATNIRNAVLQAIQDI